MKRARMTATSLRPRAADANNMTFSSRLRQSSEESLLSKSLGNAANIISRSSSEVTSITYSGYLLKRSNSPYPSVSPFPLSFDEEDTTAAGLIQLEPRAPLGEGSSSEDREPSLPQHLVGEGESKRREEIEIQKEGEICVGAVSGEKEAAQEALDALAFFFGVTKLGGSENSYSATETKQETGLKVDPGLMASEQPKNLVSPLSPSRSAPISVRQDTRGGAPKVNGFSHVARRFTAPGHSSLDPEFQENIIDPKDGHIWRSKYCVLEDGILYFYQSAAVGESLEAQRERMQSSDAHKRSSGDGFGILGTDTDLSKSPMPRRIVSSRAASLLENTSLSPPNIDAGEMWEKRVALDCVGAVRSAEQEYGECSFELLAAEEDDDLEEEDDDVSSKLRNRLILRAQNAEEMNEWLFQFHRSLNSFLQHIIQGGKLPVAAPMVGDIHYPATLYAQPPIVPSPAIHESPFSQKIHKGRTPLSHGHGRSALHRRRDKKKASPVSSLCLSSEQPGSGMSQRGETPTSAARVTPLTVERSRIEPPTRQLDLETPPEITSPPAKFPETERPKPIPRGAYVPPHKRRTNQAEATSRRYVPPHLRNRAVGEGILPVETSPPVSLRDRAAEAASSGDDTGVFELLVDETPSSRVDRSKAKTKNAVVDRVRKQSPFKRGGCADPSIAVGSILDPMFKKRSASKSGQVHAGSFGSFGGGVSVSDSLSLNSSRSLRWEIGAVSQCGVPKTNQDSYLVASDLMKGFQSLPSAGNKYFEPAVWAASESHVPGLFAVFDGHAGDQAARYAAEWFPHFLYSESLNARNGSDCHVENVEQVLRSAIASLDQEFCRLCTADGRDWESGTTALIALVAHEHLVLANLGDCRGIMCRSVSTDYEESTLHDTGWTLLESEDDSKVVPKGDSGDAPGDALSDDNLSIRTFFKELTEIHSPSRKDEHERIKGACGWVTTEKEIPIGQLQRMDFCDADVIEILKRCFSDRYHRSQVSTSPKRFNSAPQRILHISRVCGELTVSRALGDRDFKYSSETSDTSGQEDDTYSRDSMVWDGPDFLPYPTHHPRQFRGDLVSAIPEVQKLRVAEAGVHNEFLLLACDGLWDVMDPDDAIRVTRGLLYEKKWTAEKAAARLAELGIHLGSSDNITVIVIRFFTDSDN